MSRSNDVPLWLVRVGSLAMTWVWSIIAFGTAINASVKFKHDQDRVKALAPTGTQVDIHDGDVFKTGAVILAICLVLFVITSLYLALLLIRPTSFNRPRFIAIQAGILAFFATWLFAVLVPYTHFFRTHSAVITASIGGRPIPQSIVQSLVDNIGRQNGLSPRYRDHGYLRLVAILPWITLLFTIIASTVHYVAASRTKKLHHGQPVPEVAQDTPKPAAETNDKVDSPITEKAESPSV